MEQRLYSEMYDSDAFIEEHDWVQHATLLPDDLDCKREKIVAVLNTDTYGNPARTERRTRTRKTEECMEGERCGLNVCVVLSLNGRVPFNLREGERQERSG